MNGGVERRRHDTGSEGKRGDGRERHGRARVAWVGETAEEEGGPAEGEEAVAVARRRDAAGGVGGPVAPCAAGGIEGKEVVEEASWRGYARSWAGSDKRGYWVTREGPVDGGPEIWKPPNKKSTSPMAAKIAPALPEGGSPLAASVKFVQASCATSNE